MRQDVFLAEIDLEQLHARGLRTVRFAPLRKYPAVERDFSFVFGDDVEFEAMRRAVMGLRLSALRSNSCPSRFFVADRLERENIRFCCEPVCKSDEGTLRDEQIAQWSGEIVAALQGLGGMQRA